MDKAYKNLDFLNSRDARTLRILSEYLEPLSRFRRHHVTDTVVFYGSARAMPPGKARSKQERALAAYYDDARQLAFMLTNWSKALHDPKRRFIVCSGGGPGIMEAANRGASEASGISIGLGISLPSEPTINEFITRELAFEFHYFFMRKFWFVYLAKALVVFPGGFGTMDELFELLTLVQTRKVDRPLPIVLYGREFWNEVIDFDAMVRWGTIAHEDLNLFRITATPEEAFEYLQAELARNHGVGGDGATGRSVTSP